MLMAKSVLIRKCVNTSIRKYSVPNMPTRIRNIRHCTSVPCQPLASFAPHRCLQPVAWSRIDAKSGSAEE